MIPRRASHMPLQLAADEHYKAERAAQLQTEMGKRKGCDQRKQNQENYIYIDASSDIPSLCHGSSENYIYTDAISETNSLMP
ncbi:UNVERIFIED_CONTAM: hypothetical protein FKN15_046609 [Acipenser sinensis]